MFVTRRCAAIGLCSCFAAPLRAGPAPKGRPDAGAGEFAALERPAMLEVRSQTGSLKETVQNGQDLIWHRKGRSIERRFQLTNIAVAFLRSETGGQVRMTFSGNVSSLGHAADEARLTIIVRSRGGGALHTWPLSFAIKCDDRNQPLSPQAMDVPNEIAANVFTNAATVEIAENADADLPGVQARRCG
jgi:hypothetical protein